MRHQYHICIEKKKRFEIHRHLTRDIAHNQKACWVGLNSTAKRYKTISKEVAWFARVMSYKNKLNKTQ